MFCTPPFHIYANAAHTTMKKKENRIMIKNNPFCTPSSCNAFGLEVHNPLMRTQHDISAYSIDHHRGCGIHTYILYFCIRTIQSLHIPPLTIKHNAHSNSRHHPLASSQRQRSTGRITEPITRRQNRQAG